MDFENIVPHASVFLDASWKDMTDAIHYSTVSCPSRADSVRELHNMWMSHADPRRVLPCLSVRTGLDLFLQIKKFPPGSEIIVSAINIPDVIQILKHHNLRVVPLDVNMDTMSPKLELFENLISEKTVAVLLAHIYGTWFYIDPFVDLARKHKLTMIEDAAEGFCGLDYFGHPKADVTLFSFGSIKFYTSFGGAIAKIADPDIFQKMIDLHATYPRQKESDYFRKLLKYSVTYVLLNCPRFMKPGLYAINHCEFLNCRAKLLSLLRGFSGELINAIRAQPSRALLATMVNRQKKFNINDFKTSSMKACYVSERLPEAVTHVGVKATINNNWLFPVVVENPDEVVKRLIALGVEAYRGATQLNIVEPLDEINQSQEEYLRRYPHEAKFMMDHTIYLPVNKFVPFHDLDKICRAVEIAVSLSNSHRLLPLKGNVKLQSKL